MPDSHKTGPQLSLFGVVLANSTTETAGSTTPLPSSSHSWCGASLQIFTEHQPLLPPLGASRHLCGDEELKMAQSHNMGRNVPPVRAAAPHGLSNDSTPCSSEVQQWFPLLWQPKNRTVCLNSKTAVWGIRACVSALLISLSKNNEIYVMGFCMCFCNTGNQTRDTEISGEFVLCLQQW